MIFNSLVYLYFFIIMILIYWILVFTNFKFQYQNVFLLVASYIFYGWWDWQYLSLVIISTILDYSVSNLIQSTEDSKKRKFFLSISILGNLLILFTFKYYNFFIENFVDLLSEIYKITNLSIFRVDKSNFLINILLPVGISFYTFQTMSYTIDVYRKIIKAENNFINFSLFVCFFPQLVAGPIERAQDLLPQIHHKRKISIDHILQGIWYLLYGYFLKVSVADHLAEYVNKVFLDNPQLFFQNQEIAKGNGSGQILIAGMAFAFQVYADFAGYSNIAKGSAKFLGFQLSENFNCPEFSRNPVELYNRWHISLNRWFTDYIYIPLGGNRLGEWIQYRNILIIFLISGIWHGANWTFINWGIINGFYALFYVFYKKRLTKYLSYIEPMYKFLHPKIRIFLSILLTFTFFGIAAISFRCYNFEHSLILYKDLLTNWDLIHPTKSTGNFVEYFLNIFKIILPVLILDYFRWKENDPEWLLKKSLTIQIIVLGLLYFTIILNGVFGKDVIYFAF